jgi:hypothetical protein
LTISPANAAMALLMDAQQRQRIHALRSAIEMSLVSVDRSFDGGSGGGDALRGGRAAVARDTRASIRAIASTDAAASGEADDGVNVSRLSAITPLDESG